METRSLRSRRPFAPSNRIRDSDLSGERDLGQAGCSKPGRRMILLRLPRRRCRLAGLASLQPLQRLPIKPRGTQSVRRLNDAWSTSAYEPTRLLGSNRSTKRQKDAYFCARLRPAVEVQLEEGLRAAKDVGAAQESNHRNHGITPVVAVWRATLLQRHRSTERRLLETSRAEPLARRCRCVSSTRASQ
jgi:hypothetical protein